MLPGGRVRTGGIEGGGGAASPVELSDSGNWLELGGGVFGLMGSLVQGSRCTVAGFFSSGLGIGEGSGGAVEGCTVGASGMSASCAGACAGGVADWVCVPGWLGELCAQVAGTMLIAAMRQVRARAVAGRGALLRQTLEFAAVSMLIVSMLNAHLPSSDQKRRSGANRWSEPPGPNR